MEISPQTVGAVDIGGTKIAVGLVASDGRLLANVEFPTRPQNGPLAAVQQIEQVLKSFLTSTGSSLQAIGIGCTGPVDPLSGTVGEVALLPGWNDFQLADALNGGFKVPVTLENDCDAAALAEATWGIGTGLDRFLFVSLSTGIGAGLILDGQIYRGANGIHPELGHMTIDPSGPECYCGSRGCWESLASGTAITAWHNLQTNSNPPLEASQIFALALNCNDVALQSVNRLTTYLGIGLGNLITLFAPQRIALGGGLMRSHDLFLARAVAQAVSRSGLIPANTVSILPAALGTNAGLLGAAATAHLHLKQGIIC